MNGRTREEARRDRFAAVERAWGFGPAPAYCRPHCATCRAAWDGAEREAKALAESIAQSLSDQIETAANALGDAHEGLEDRWPYFADEADGIGDKRVRELGIAGAFHVLVSAIRFKAMKFLIADAMLHAHDDDELGDTTGAAVETAEVRTAVQ